MLQYEAASGRFELAWQSSGAPTLTPTPTPTPTPTLTPTPTPTLTPTPTPTLTSGKRKWASRLNLIFDEEDESKFHARVAAAKQLRAHVEEATRCDFYARHEVVRGRGRGRGRGS